MSLEPEMLGDYRPSYSLWKRCFPDFTVIVVQGEGGELLDQDLQNGFRAMKKTIQASARYVTFYDLTDCMQNLLPHAATFIQFALEMRPYSLERQLCIVAVCPDEKVRNWVRWILSMAASSTPYFIFKTCAEAWAHVEKGCGASGYEQCGEDAFGSEAALPSSLGGGGGVGLDASFLMGLL